MAPGTPLVVPAPPLVLVIDPMFTQYQIMIAKTQYETALPKHQTYVLLQRLLISQVQEAVERKYTITVKNCITGQLPSDIQLLKDHLFNTYRKINENELQAKYDKTTQLSYNISDPIDYIFNAVEDLCETAELSQSPYAARQQVSIGYLIIIKQPVFRSDLRKVDEEAIGRKKRMNLINHFRQGHQERRDTDTAIDQIGFQSANAIVKQIIDQLREENESMDDNDDIDER